MLAEEGLLRSKVFWLDEIEQGPEFVEAVLQGGAGEQQAVAEFTVNSRNTFMAINSPSFELAEFRQQLRLLALETMALVDNHGQEGQFAKVPKPDQSLCSGIKYRN